MGEFYATIYPRLFCVLTDEYFADRVFQNNKKFTIWKDMSLSTVRPILRICCENKPVNLPAHGIIWKEFNL